MSELHSDLREAQRVLSEAGIRTAEHGDRLVQYATGIVGLYSMVKVGRLADGRRLVDGRTLKHAREGLIENGFRVLQTEVSG